MPIVSWTFSVHINVKPEEAFDYVADLTRHNEWSSAPLKVEAVSPGPVRVGSQYRSVGHMLGQELHDDLRVTDYQPSSRFSFVVREKGQPIELRHEFTFQSQEDGTLVVRTISANVSPLRRLLALLLTPIIQPETTKSQQLLKTKLEQLYPKVGATA
jgi:uncharacterized protein YndB with AHSA1/START domain